MPETKNVVINESKFKKLCKIKQRNNILNQFSSLFKNEKGSQSSWKYCLESYFKNTFFQYGKENIKDLSCSIKKKKSNFNKEESYW